MCCLLGNSTTAECRRGSAETRSEPMEPKAQSAGQLPIDPSVSLDCRSAENDTDLRSRTTGSVLARVRTGVQRRENCCSAGCRIAGKKSRACRRRWDESSALWSSNHLVAAGQWEKVSRNRRTMTGDDLSAAGCGGRSLKSVAQRQGCGHLAESWAIVDQLLGTLARRHLLKPTYVGDSEINAGEWLSCAVIILGVLFFRALLVKM